MTRPALMDRLLKHVEAEPEIEAAHRWRQIERAACDFRRAYRFSRELVRVSFPPMTATEAERARRAAYHWSYHAFCGQAGVEAYRAEVAAINAAEVA
ncbi:MAG: hypothetical protein ACK40C_09200 [Novosphingobium meiothermophilum]